MLSFTLFLVRLVTRKSATLGVGQEAVISWLNNLKNTKHASNMTLCINKDLKCDL